MSVSSNDLSRYARDEVEGISTDGTIVSHATRDMLSVRSPEESAGAEGANQLSSLPEDFRTCLCPATKSKDLHYVSTRCFTRRTLDYTNPHMRERGVTHAMSTYGPRTGCPYTIRDNRPHPMKTCRQIVCELHNAQDSAEDPDEVDIPEGTFPLPPSTLRGVLDLGLRRVLSFSSGGTGN